MKNGPLLALVAGNDEDVLADISLVMNLCFQNWHVETTNCLAKCIEIANNKDTGLIILDKDLADGDGFDALTKIRQFSNTPVIFLSDMDDGEDLVKALDRGADEYITKPFRLTEFAAHIRSLTRNRSDLVIFLVQSIGY